MADEVKPGIEVQPKLEGPGNNSVPPPAQKDAVTTPPAAAAPYYKGIAGEAKSPEELVEYTRNLEAKLVEKELAARTNPPQGQTIQSFQETPVSPAMDPKAVKTLKEQFADVVYTDPEKAFDLVHNAAVETIEKRGAIKSQEQQWWNDFYSENPDLKSAERVVKSVVGEKFEEIKKLDLASAKKFLATESRKFIDGIKANFGTTTTELPSGPAMSFGSSQGKQAASGGQKPAAPVSFIDQMREIRASRNKRA